MCTYIHTLTCFVSLTFRGSPLARLLKRRTPGFRGVNVMTLATKGQRDDRGLRSGYMTHIAGWKIPHQWRFVAGKIIYFYGDFSMAMLNNQRLPEPTKSWALKKFEPHFVVQNHVLFTKKSLDSEKTGKSSFNPRFQRSFFGRWVFQETLCPLAISAGAWHRTKCLPWRTLCD